MIRRSVVAGSLICATVLFSSLGRSQEGDEWVPGHRRGMRLGPRMLAMLESERARTELGLTDQQVERLRQVVVENEKASVKTRAEISVKRLELREQLRVEKPDRDAVMKKVQEISDLRGQMMKQRVDSLLTAKTVLTPEQQKKMRAFMRERAFAGRWRRDRRPRFHPGPEEPAPPRPPVPPGQE